MAIFRPATPSLEKSDRSAGDRLRHRQKVRASIRENIADIIAEEAIIGKNRDRVIKVPIRGIKEYRFLYGENNPGVGQGEGKGTTEPGQVVGKVTKDGEKGADRADDRPGQDYYETEITLEELIDIMFEDLALRDMERKALRTVLTETKRKNIGWRHRGPRVHLGIRRTVRERKKRLQETKGAIREREKELQAVMLSGDPEKSKELQEKLKELYLWKSILENPNAYVEYLKEHPEDQPRFPFHERDLRFRRRKEKPREESNAVVFCIMDTSGSMDTMKKYLARSFFFLLCQFISTKYRQVEIVFIAHHTEAKEVSEEEFFHKGESGGTFISSAYQKMLEVVASRYHPSLWNIYAFHCSDGDNFATDNSAALKAAAEICKIANLFGYGEIKPEGVKHYEFSMLEIFKNLKAENFMALLIEKKSEIWPAFKRFLSKEKGVEK